MRGRRDPLGRPAYVWTRSAIGLTTTTLIPRSAWPSPDRTDRAALDTRHPLPDAEGSAVVLNASRHHGEGDFSAVRGVHQLGKVLNASRHHPLCQRE